MPVAGAVPSPGVHVADATPESASGAGALMLTERAHGTVAGLTVTTGGGTTGGVPSTRVTSPRAGTVARVGGGVVSLGEHAESSSATEIE